MKRIQPYILILLFMSASTSTWALTAKEELASLGGESIVLLNEHDVLSAEQATLDAAAKEIEKSQKLQNLAITRYNQDANALRIDANQCTMDFAPLKARIEQHNANKPDPTSGSAVDAYNSEKRDLDNEVDVNFKQRWADLNKRIDDDNFIRKGLENSQKSINESTLTWVQSQKSLNSRWDDLQVRLDNLKKKMVEPCKKLMMNPKTKNEALKHGCGNIQFDGADPDLPEL